MAPITEKSEIRLRKLLSLAGRITTNPHEAVNALQRIYDLLDEHGLQFDDLGLSNDLSTAENKELTAENKELARKLADAERIILEQNIYIQELEIANANLEHVAEDLIEQAAAQHVARIRHLEGEVLDLEARLQTISAERDAAKLAQPSHELGEYVSFESVEAAAEAVAGRKGWRTAAASMASMSMQVFRAWAVIGLFPAQAARLLAEATPDDLAPASRQRWAPDEMRRLGALLKKGITALEAAKSLTAEFGRRIYETTITRRASEALASLTQTHHPRSAGYSGAAYA